jgi:hypothetical protein
VKEKKLNLNLCARLRLAMAFRAAGDANFVAALAQPTPMLLLDRRQLDWSWIHPSLLRAGSEAPMDWIRAVWSSWSSEAYDSSGSSASI